MKAVTLGLAAALIGGVAMAQVTTTTPAPAPAAPAPGAPRIPGTTTGTPTQLNSTNNSSPTPPAVTTSNADNKTSAAPVSGRNSFTAGQARRRLEAGGFSQVTDLRKDRNGVWRGRAMRGADRVNVYCDYQGNVGAQ